ncbi:hypothetical protein [Natrarchaeobaculum sulfurireducens]|uniref:Cell surface protein n=1 Tax=Natrarchaeobaculum sulfurireducens TaxID=2044521 RepID=A0A346PGY0_9EURY|nr:hypothetical protein [Natrarchaeobaculum sulfurireducens]AXR78775.1 Cell surface protein [Natrarchaeobaculum sulfurireducens]
MLVAVTLFCVFALTTAAGVAGAAVDSGGANGAVPAANTGEAVDTECNPDDDAVVVRFDDEHVVSGAIADDCPADPHVHLEDNTSAKLVVENGTVQTIDGDKATVGDRNVFRFSDEDPDLRVADGEFVNSSLIMSDNGTVVLEEDETEELEVDGDPVVFEGDPQLRLSEPTVSEGAEGEEVDIDVDIEYLGYHEFNGNLSVDIVNESGQPTSADEADITLENREEITETITFETRNGDAPEVEVLTELSGDAGVSNPAAQNKTRASIEEARIAVDIADYNRPEEGDDLEVTAVVERIGALDRDEFNESYQLVFEVDGSTVDSRSIEPLDAGSSEERTFVYSTVEGDGPNVDVKLSALGGAGDRTVEETLEVISPDAHERDVQANITSWNAPEEGEELEIEADIEHDNLPDGTHTYPIEFSVDGNIIDETNVTLSGPGSDSETVDFTYDVQQGDAPDVQATVSTPGERDRITPRIFGSGFELQIVETNAPVNETETLQTTVAVQNTGDIEATQDVRLVVDQGGGDPDRNIEHLRDNTSVSLSPGESTTERLSFRTEDDDPNKIDLIARSENDEDIKTVRVRPLNPFFEIEDLDLPESVEPDEEFTVSASINNTGAEAGTQYIEVETEDGELAHIDRITLPPVEHTTVSFTDTAPSSPGTYEYTFMTEDDEVERTLSVSDGDDEPSDVEPEDDEPDDPEPDDDLEPDDDVDDAEEPDEEPDADEDDGLSWFMVLLGVLGVAASVLVLLVYRNDPENFPPDPATVRAQLESTFTREALEHRLERAKMTAAALVAAIKAGDINAIVTTLKHAIGLGSGTLVVQNELPRETLVRIRCQTADDTVLLEDLELGPNERRTLGSLPSVDQFKVGAGVEDITAHEEVFQGASGDVGVVLRPEGILIANLG